MASIKARLKRLEKTTGRREVYPYVVFYDEDECIEEAKLRVLNGRPAPKNWRYILAPRPMEEGEWVRKYSPEPRPTHP